MDDALAGDVITLSATEGLCAGHYQLPSFTTITLQGEDGAGFDQGGATTQTLFGAHIADTTVRNLIFRNGTSTNGNGGAIDIVGAGSPVLDHLSFFGNTANGANGNGGAVFVQEATNTTVSNSTFGSASPGDGNSATNFGGAFATAGKATLVGDRFIGNHASAGGAIARQCGDIDIEGSVFASNAVAASGQGSAIYTVISCGTFTVEFDDTTIVASLGGTALAGDASETVALKNTILWNNATSAITGFGTVTSSFSDVCTSTGVALGGTGNTGNICSDPQLVDPANGNVHQTSLSPTIDTGSNALVPPALTADIDGQDRIFDGDGDSVAVVDIGADELVFPETTISAAKVNRADRKAKFKFKAAPVGGTFECSLDKKPAKACSSPKTYSGLKLGKHTFEVQARDSLGNLDPTPAEHAFRI